MASDYRSIAEYMRKPKLLNYMKFDYDVTHGLTLFTLDPDFSFEELEKTSDVILGALPAIKRIFEQPFIHLKEQDVIMPVEAVRTVNNSTLTHIATHSELWADVKDGEIKPDKLLTRTYEDNYGIYENLVFCDVVDDILAYARANMRFLRELIYTNRTIEIDLLERVNHLDYFLALGKLHIGYSKSFDAYYPLAARCLNKLNFILNAIVPRLKRPVYKNNRLRPLGLKVRKTNILSMHKEYHRIYRLAKFFRARSDAPDRDPTDAEIAELEKTYFYYCQALLSFAVGNFGFACDEKRIFNLTRTMPRFTFKTWTVEPKKTTVDKTPVIEISITKDRPYKAVLIPSLEADNAELLAAVKVAAPADEYIVCSPHEDCGGGAMFIDISSIESFRRLQRVVLRGMIYADTQRTECPFCSNKLTAADGADGVYECNSCRTVIGEATCAETGKRYFYTGIKGLRPHADGRAEGAMYYRNITELDDDLAPICPHCGTACNK